MPPNLSTSNRIYFLTLQDYGEDDLLIESMSGREGLSQLFEFKLRLLSERDDIDPEMIIGRSAILRIETWDASHSGGERHWNGFVSRFTTAGRVQESHDGRGDLFAYECDIVPWFWFLTQNEDCRIFQELSIPEIIETIFGEFAFSDYKLELTEQHPKLEYCAQYYETSFDFISRLIEREGIYYYFRHHDEGGETKHLLVFTDNKDSNPALDPAELPFHHAGHAYGSDAVRSLARTEQMRTRRITLHDWDYAQRNAVGENTPTVLRIGVDRDLERYRYPGGFAAPSGQSDSALGKYLSQVLMESEEASHLRFRGDSQIRALAPGHTFTLYDHGTDAFNTEYLLVTVWHHGRNNLRSDGGSADYGNEFTLQPHETVYRAPLATPRGLVRGPQTAIVTGPPGEEVYTDDYGRIKVRFHWDRKVPGRQTDMPDDRASCWVRVAQMWAGNGYGSMFIPRVGMEVVVDFLEGDPDRPIVVGCVYNGVNQPPYALPSEQTKSTIKTLSSKGGGGYNELRFEDKAGDEEIFVHAQKNLQLRTGNCRTESIGVHSDLTVGKNRAETIGENATTTIGMNQTESIGSNRATTVGADDTWTVGGSQDTDVGGSMSLTTGMDFDLNAGMGAALTAGLNIEAKAGMNIVLDAGLMISLKAGGSSIVIGPAGVSITGPMVLINSGGAPPLSAKQAKKAEKADKPQEAKKAISGNAGRVTNPVQQLQAAALRTAAAVAAPFCAECAARLAALQALRSGG